MQRNESFTQRLTVVLSYILIVIFPCDLFAETSEERYKQLRLPLLTGAIVDNDIGRIAMFRSKSNNDRILGVGDFVTDNIKILKIKGNGVVLSDGKSSYFHKVGAGFAIKERVAPKKEIVQKYTKEDLSAEQAVTRWQKLHRIFWRIIKNSRKKRGDRSIVQLENEPYGVLKSSGLRKGDIILSYNGKNTEFLSYEYFEKNMSQPSIELKIKRKDKIATLKIDIV